MEQKELISYLESEGYHQIKEIKGRGLCGLREFVFTIGVVEGLTEDSYEGRWCYPKENGAEAYLAMSIWDGESDPPGNWVKYKGRRGEYTHPKIKQYE
jgi:hypothetical protein